MYRLLQKRSSLFNGLSFHVSPNISAKVGKNVKNQILLNSGQLRLVYNTSAPTLGPGSPALRPYPHFWTPWPPAPSLKYNQTPIFESTDLLLPNVYPCDANQSCSTSSPRIDLPLWLLSTKLLLYYTPYTICTMWPVMTSLWLRDCERDVSDYCIVDTFSQTPKVCRIKDKAIRSYMWAQR